MLGNYWREGDFEVCQKIQKLVFPEGALWDHENRRFRTDGMNPVMMYLFSLSNTYKNDNAKKEGKSADLSSLVGHRIEISNPFLKDFEVVILFVEWIDEKVPNYR